MPIRARNGCSIPLPRQIDVQLLQPPLHVDGHGEAGARVLLDALRFRIAEEGEDRIADELVDRRAVLQRDVGHLGKVLVQERRQILRLQPLRDGGEILDVGEEDRELLALGRDRHILLPAEDALVDLRRQIFCDLHRDRGEEIVGLGQLVVHALDQRRLPALQEDEGKARDARQHEIRQQELERENVRDDRLRDRDLLDAADVALLPVLLRAERMRVVAGDADLPHEHRRGRSDDAVQRRPCHLDDRAASGSARSASMRILLEGVEVVILPALERQVGDEPVSDRAVMSADPLAELDGERRGNRDRARHVEIIVRRRHRLGRLQHAPDHVARIEAAHLVDDAADFARLASEQALRQARGGRARRRAAARAARGSPLPREAVQSSAAAVRRVHRALPWQIHPSDRPPESTATRGDATARTRSAPCSPDGAERNPGPR